MLAQTMLDQGFKPCEADPDVWLRPANKPDGTPVYDYVLIYVDDVLAISCQATKLMEDLAELYRFKEDPSTKKRYAPPERYLGANIGKYTTSEDSREKWYMSSDEYVKNAVRNVEQNLSEIGKGLTKMADKPFTTGYHPELDVTPELMPEKANYYQEMIGVLRWAVELGRIDIHVQVALLSQYLANPREGHLDQCFHIFAYLKGHGRSKLVLDDAMVDWEKSGKFQQVD